MADRRNRTFTVMTIPLRDGNSEGWVLANTTHQTVKKENDIEVSIR